MFTTKCRCKRPVFQSDFQAHTSPLLSRLLCSVFLSTLFPAEAAQTPALPVNDNIQKRVHKHANICSIYSLVLKTFSLHANKFRRTHRPEVQTNKRKLEVRSVLRTMIPLLSACYLPSIRLDHSPPAAAWHPQSQLPTDTQKFSAHNHVYINLICYNCFTNITITSNFIVTT